MKKIVNLNTLLQSNGVSACLVDLELLSAGTLRGVGIFQGRQVDIISSTEVDDRLCPLRPVINFYADDSLIHTIKL